MALAVVDDLSYWYPGVGRPALDDVSLTVEPGEKIALLGSSGCGKSTLLRALAGLVPHFHGGRFSGRLEVAGHDTRRTRAAELAGMVASVFQDPEEQVVMGRVVNELAFGLENVSIPPARIWSDARAALEAVGAVHLAERRTMELSGGELQRVCLASALALQPRLLLLDEPTSQLDPEGADEFLDLVARLDAAVVLAEHLPVRAFEIADRVIFMEGGGVVLDAPAAGAAAWLEEHRPRFAPAWEEPALHAGDVAEQVLSVAGVAFAYEPGIPALDCASLDVGRGELVVLEGPNGSGKTTLAKIAAGLLEPATGMVRRSGRAGYVSQDPGRYVVCETALEEVALAVGGDERRARAALEVLDLGWAADRHPRDLSSGERARLGVAAVMVAEPDLLILDEPTRGLDPDRRHDLATVLLEYADRGHGVLVVTHDAGFPAHRRVTLAHERRRVAVHA